jgi:hypothetical protein
MWRPVEPLKFDELAGAWNQEVTLDDLRLDPHCGTPIRHKEHIRLAHRKSVLYSAGVTSLLADIPNYAILKVGF